MRMPTIPGRPLESPLEFSLAETSLSVRTTGILEAAGIFSVQDLLNCSETDLLCCKNFGEKGLKEVHRALRSLGIKERPQAA